MKPRRKALWIFVLGFALFLGVGLWTLFHGSTSTFPNQNPVGEPFPPVVGQSLAEETVEIPGAFSGRPAVLLIGYLQEAQFDIDRWLMGLLQAEAEAQLVELPTIPGLLPSFASEWIDDGMRSGIPRQDWGAVVTLYGDTARPVAELTGTERGRLARVVVLDSEGQIAWFDDGGYAPRKALEVARLVSTLGDGSEAEGSQPGEPAEDDAPITGAETPDSSANGETPDQSPAH